MSARRRRVRGKRTTALTRREGSRSFAALGMLSEPTQTSGPSTMGPLGIEKKWWLVGTGVAGLGLIALAFWKRDAITAAGESAVATAKSLIFKQIIPAGAKPYADIILRVAKEQKVDPLTIVALGIRESNWGASLRADKTGDHTVRTGAWLDTTKGKRSIVQAAPSGWSVPKGKVAPFAIPQDGKGWGRGIMQVDYDRAVYEKHDWTDPYKNITLGARIFREKAAYLTKNTSVRGADLVVAAIAAYNAGEGTITAALKSGGMPAIDRYTTGGDYSTKVAGMIANLARAYANAGGGDPTELVA